MWNSREFSLLLSSDGCKKTEKRLPTNSRNYCLKLELTVVTLFGDGGAIKLFSGVDKFSSCVGLWSFSGESWRIGVVSSAVGVEEMNRFKNLIFFF